MSNPTALRRLRLNLVAVALLLFLLIAFAVHTILLFAIADRWETHTYQVMLENNSMSRALDDMYISARDYALTGDPVRLEMLHQNDTVFSAHYQNILALTADNSIQQANLARLLQQKNAWGENYLKPVEAMGGAQPAVAPSRRLFAIINITIHGKNGRDVVRRTLDAITSEENIKLGERSREQVRLQKLAVLTLSIGAAALALIVAALSTVLLRRVNELSTANTILQNEMAQRTLVQQEILESQLIFHTFMNNNPAAAFMKDSEGRIRYVNEPMQKVFGITADRLIGQTDAVWMPDDVARKTRQSDAEVLASGKPREVIEMIPTPDGVLHSWLILKFPFQNRDGETLLGGVAIDITQRIEAEDKLKISESGLSALIENTSDSILSVDRQYRLITFNSAFAGLLERVLDITPHIGDNHLNLLPPATRARWLSLYDRVFNGEHFTFEHSLELNGAPLDLEIALNPIVADGVVTGASVFSRDITERKKIDRLKSEFISTVSHELRTPLTSIRGSLGLLAGGIGGEMPPESRKLIDIALSNSERLVRLINDILDIDKIESGKMTFDLKTTPLLPLLLESIEANRAYAQRLGVSLSFVNALPPALLQNTPLQNNELQDNQLIVRVDPDRFLQVMANLLSNAAKFSPAGENIEVKVKLLTSSDIADTPPTIQVSVQDNGSGVPPEFHDRIFHKFAQADASDTRQKGGTGLGLSISKAIVENFGGTIGFTSPADGQAAGGGTVFFFSLPIWREPKAFQLPLKETGQCSNILICEDEPDIARLLCMMLQQIGCDCTIAVSAAEAKNLLQNGQFDAMTLDLMLPDEDGVSLIRELRSSAETHDLPIIVVSARAGAEHDELSGDAIGIVDWLKKPIDNERLLAAVSRAVAHCKQHHPRILHVEDDADIVQVVAAILHEAAAIESAGTLQEARAKLSAVHYDLVILDAGLPDGSGLELLPLLHGSEPPIPVAIFSARELGRHEAQDAETALVKSRTSNQELLKTIRGLLQNVPLREVKA